MKVLQTLLGHKTATRTLDATGTCSPLIWAVLRTLSTPLLNALRTLRGQFRHYGQSHPTEIRI